MQLQSERSFEYACYFAKAAFADAALAELRATTVYSLPGSER